MRPGTTFASPCLHIVGASLTFVVCSVLHCTLKDILPVSLRHSQPLGEAPKSDPARSIKQMGQVLSVPEWPQGF